VLRNGGAVANHLARVLARFEARIHNTKNRQVSIPADIQRELRLVRQTDNHLLLYSIRPKGEGRWNHHWAQLTIDNEFSVPADAVHIERGCLVEVKIHRLVKNVDALDAGENGAAGGAALLLQLAAAGDDDQVGDSREVDEQLYGGDA
jgi:hypothetical protein